MTSFDVFSGIGGFALGMGRASIEAIGFCESNEYRRRVLQKHWPDVPIINQVQDAAQSCLGEFDVLCGGPPCQRTSNAAAIKGKRTGETLWPFMFAIAERCCPEWIVVEQPVGNAHWEAKVEADLARAGYHTSRLQRTAASCGAPHLRRRVFFVANAMRERCEAVARIAGSSAAITEPWPAPPGGTWRTSGAGNRRMDDGFSDWVDRLAGLGDSVVPQVVEQIGRAIVAVSSSAVLESRRGEEGKGT